jgi:nucleoside-diphosphate-sugar epimerase
VLLKKFLTREAVLEGDGSRFINQIHRDDAAAAIALLAMRKERGIFNVADDAPLSQLEVYSWLANHFARALPPYGPIDPNRKRGWTHKQVSNAKLRALGWAPRFPSFHEAVRDDAELLRGIEECG